MIEPYEVHWVEYEMKTEDNWDDDGYNNEFSWEEEVNLFEGFDNHNDAYKFYKNKKNEFENVRLLKVELI